MAQEPSSQKSQICPTCGTRLSENAARCLVCGTDLTAKAASKSKTTEGMGASRMPEITLSLPVALGALTVVLLIGALVVYLILSSGATGATITQPTDAGTPTATTTVTPTPTETLPPTDIPTETPLPPFDYTVRAGDTCAIIAPNFSVSVQVIVVANNLPASCLIAEANVFKIPYPTSTPNPPPLIFQSGLYEPRSGWLLKDFNYHLNKLIDLGNKMDVNEVDALTYWLMTLRRG